MSTLVKTRDYEILIRVHADGSIGAHCATITEIIVDGEILSSKENPPFSLSTATTEGVMQLHERLGDVAAAALSNNSVLLKQNTDLRDSVATLTSEAKIRDEEIVTLSASEDSKTNEIERLTREFASAQAEALRLSLENSALTERFRPRSTTSE